MINVFKPGEVVDAAEALQDMKRSSASQHAVAAAEWLEHFAKELRRGTAPEDIGWMVEKIGVMMARKI